MEDDEEQFNHAFVTDINTSDNAVQQCQGCGNDAVIFDDVEGLSVCESCGRVANNGHDLVHQLFHTSKPERSGITIQHSDSGLNASHAILKKQYGVALPHAHKQSTFRYYKQHFDVYVNQLQLQPPLIEEALSYLKQLIPLLYQVMKRREIAISSIYLALRQNSAPLTLADMSSLTDTSPRTIGRHYLACRLALGLSPPVTSPQVLVPRSVVRVLPAESDHGIRARVERDAIDVLGWMEEGIAQIGQRFASVPLYRVSGAIFVAMEMNSIHMRHAQIAKSLVLSEVRVRHEVHNLRSSLMRYIHLLPYKMEVDANNVFLHTKAIIRLAKLFGGGSGQETEWHRRVSEKAATRNATISRSRGQRNAPVLALPPPSSAAVAHEKKEEEESPPNVAAAVCMAENNRKPKEQKKSVRFTDEGGVTKKKKTNPPPPPKGRRRKEEEEEEGDEVDADGDLDAFDDSDIEQYLRTDEEVEALGQLQDVLGMDFSGDPRYYGKNANYKKIKK